MEEYENGIVQHVSRIKTRDYMENIDVNGKILKGFVRNKRI